MAKLVLDIEPEIINGLLKSAEEKHISVSEFVKDLYKKTNEGNEGSTDYKKKLSEYPEWIQRLVIADKPTPDFDHKAEYGRHLEEKYGL